MELVKFKPRFKEDYYLFQKVMFDKGVKVHSQRDNEELDLIEWNLAEKDDKYKGSILDKPPYGICLFEDSRGVYMQNVDSLNYNLSKNTEITVEDLKS